MSAVTGQTNIAMPTSPERSSSESCEAEEDTSHQLSSENWQMLEHTSASSVGTSPQQSRITAPLQKRRRVTRACDECRRKKIKCDGKQPCTHCTVYSYDCTYDQPSNRRRNPAPQYIEALENRLHRTEALLRTFILDIDMSDAKLDTLIRQRQGIERSALKSELEQDKAIHSEQEGSTQDTQLQSMIETTGQLDLDDFGYCDFHGGSSGMVFLKRMREQFGGLLGGSDAKTPFLPKQPRPTSPIFDSLGSTDSPFETGLPNTLDLPSKEVALQLCYNSLHHACSLLMFVHRPTFHEMFERIYNTLPQDFGDEENRFLPLLYVVMALGCRFTSASASLDVEDADYQATIDQGLKYFKAGRSMMNITDCRDITSLQAILFMILYLQTSSNLSTCYSYIGVALRSALRMGLHRNLSSKFNLIEREVRRRVFWIIRKMDTYVSALLGFPRLLSDEDIDQELPVEVDDEYITKEEILLMPAGKISLYAACNAHTRLMGILAKVIKYIYPIKGVERSLSATSSPSYIISHTKIREVERDLKDWHEILPIGLRPGGDASEDVLRVQQLLRIAYAHVQMMLYRPFLHYVSRTSRNGRSFDDRAYACAAACVNVSRNIVHITTEMNRRGLLKGAYWFTIYTTFFAILSLAYFVHENPDKQGSQEILADARAGRDALKCLAKRNLPAEKCSNTLVGLFEQLPEKLKRSRTDSLLATKKRSASPLSQAAARGVYNSLGLLNTVNASIVHRAIAFPIPTNTPLSEPNQQTVSFDTSQYPSNSAADQNHRHNFQELATPIEISGSATPDSANSMQSSLNFQQPFTYSNGVPDIAAMMFPSTDPFVYPNHPMIEYDSRQQKYEVTGIAANGSAISTFLSSGTSPYDILEGQHFGPLPPYMSAGQLDITQIDIYPVSGMNMQDMRTHSGLTPGAGMDFDAIFAGKTDDWNTAAD